MSRRAVFLDRDGVINRAILRDNRPLPPASLRELEILPGVREAMASLRDAGYLLIVVTNQPDAARGATTRSSIDEINAQLLKSLPIDEIRTCFHGGDGECNCRKPKPGLLLDAAKKWDIELDRSFMVGDRWKDVAAGRAAGCTTLFVDRGYAEPMNESPDHRVGSLDEAARIILEQGARKHEAH